MLSSAASAQSGFQLLSGSGSSVPTEIHMTDGGPPTNSVSSVLTESHLTVGRPRAPDMISELSESCRAVKHDRHGNPVPERAISAAAVYPHPSAVVSVLTEHGTGGGSSAAAQQVAPAAAPLSSLDSGYASADFPVSGVTVGPSSNFGVTIGPSPICGVAIGPTPICSITVGPTPIQSPTRCNGEALANFLRMFSKRRWSRPRARRQLTPGRPRLFIPPYPWS